MKVDILLKNLDVDINDNNIRINNPSITVSLIDLKKAIMDNYKKNFKFILNKYIGEKNNADNRVAMKNEIEEFVEENEKDISKFIKNYIFDNIDINII